MMYNQSTGFFYLYNIMRKVFKQLHTWLSIPAGIIIIITCLTGAILVFQDEILELTNPSRYFVKEVKAEPLSLDKLIPLVNQNLKKNTISNVKVSSDPKRTYVMQIANSFRESVFVNQYTGEIVGIYKTQGSFFYTVMQMHRWLMDGSRTAGKYAVGIATLLLVFILISGIIIWFPRNKKNLKKYFTIKKKNGKKRFLFDLHRVLGIYASLIIIVCCLTGLMWSFEWYRNSVLKLFGAEVTNTNGANGHGNKHGAKKGGEDHINFTNWELVLNNLKDKNENFDYIRISDKTANVHSKNAPTSRASDSFVFDSNSGNIVKTHLYIDQEKRTKVWGWVYDLHVGKYWGMFSKILTFIAALIGASLPITGYYLFFAKRRKRRKR